MLPCVTTEKRVQSNQEKKSVDQQSYCVICQKPLGSRSFPIHAEQLHSHNVFVSSGTKIGKPLPPHVIKDSENLEFRCAVCGALFLNEITASLHAKSVHFEQPLAACCKCGTLNELEEQKYECQVCKRLFKKPHQLKNHESTHLKEEDKPYQCKICMKYFATKGHYKRHQRLHQEDNIFFCKICEKGFVSNALFQQHMRVHRDDRPFTCRFCGKSFSYSSSLRDHELLHSKDSRKFKCPICFKGFIKNHKLKLHMLTHSEVKPHQCDICPKQFIRKGDLEVHLLWHNEVLPYQCTVCSKQYVTAAKLKQHELTHSGERPYMCLICGTSYQTRSGLKYHKYSTHDLDSKDQKLYHQMYQKKKKKKEKHDYLCCTCNKRFHTTRDSIQKHVKFHVSETVFFCSKCQATFQRSSTLQSHEKICKGEISEHSCEVCHATFSTKKHLMNHKKGSCVPELPELPATH